MGAVLSVSGRAPKGSVGDGLAAGAVLAVAEASVGVAALVELVEDDVLLYALCDEEHAYEVVEGLVVKPSSVLSFGLPWIHGDVLSVGSGAWSRTPMSPQSRPRGVTLIWVPRACPDREPGRLAERLCPAGLSARKSVRSRPKAGAWIRSS